MHELSLVQELIALVEEQVKAHQVKKVHRIVVRIGKMAAVVPSSLTFCFEILSRGSQLEGAILEIEEIPIRCRCTRCQEEFEVESFIFFCPKCQGSELKQLSGRECLIHHLEVD
ncbi:MAG: hydrogenase maturation nickel metallochaperone HypA [bacterium]|nr:hydrogenase maturation nickel metallochaperone HypA [bacterium]